MGWTDERVALLKKMWKDGNSAADIAKALGKGVTRNAVIGKAHRMGLSGRPSPIKGENVKPEKTEKKKPAATKEKAAPASKAKSDAKAEKAEKVKVKEAEKAPAKKGRKKSDDDDKGIKFEVDEEIITDNSHNDLPPLDGGVGLIDLTERMCRWPYGDPKEEGFTFCGRQAYPGKPYCADHVLMAYQASSRARAAAKMKEAAMEDDLDVDINDVEEEEIDEDDVGNVD